MNGQPYPNVNRSLAGHDEAAVQQAPAACPFCRSSKTTTASEKIDSSTYWRCEACGQMWNVGRLRVRGRY
jgi:ribosomal protein L37AE/L43A